MEINGKLVTDVGHLSFINNYINNVNQLYTNNIKKGLYIILDIEWAEHPDTGDTYLAVRYRSNNNHICICSIDNFIKNFKSL